MTATDSTHPTTRVRPHGIWMHARQAGRLRSHLVDQAWATWLPTGPRYGGQAKCGAVNPIAAFSLDVPDDRICDRCLLGEAFQAVYRAFGRGDVLLYVGYSADLPGRLDSHRRESPWWPRMVRLEYEVFETEALARASEAQAIKYERPVYNSAQPRVEVDEAPAGRKTRIRREIANARAAELGAYTDQERSQLMGIGRATLCRMTKGTDLRVGTMRRVAASLGVGVTELFEEVA